MSVLLRMLCFTC